MSAGVLRHIVDKAAALKRDTDVQVRPDAYYLTIDLRDAPHEAVRVDVTPCSVHVRAPGETVVLHQTPRELDVERSQATYYNGVLDVTAPFLHSPPPSPRVEARTSPDGRMHAAEASRNAATDLPESGASPQPSPASSLRGACGKGEGGALQHRE